jgi:hypothetical protein
MSPFAIGLWCWLGRAPENRLPSQLLSIIPLGSGFRPQYIVKAIADPTTKEAAVRLSIVALSASASLFKTSAMSINTIVAFFH